MTRVYPRNPLPRKIAFSTVQRSLDNFIHDMRILSGDIVGQSNATVHAVTQTALVNLGVVKRFIRQQETAKVFPEVRIRD